MRMPLRQSLAQSAQQRLLHAVYTFLVPVARCLLRAGISYSEFVEISRVAFVKVGSEDYGIRGRPTNASRIAAMTGIARREVSRLRRKIREYDDDPRTQLSPLGDVLHVWFTSPEYLDGRGEPLHLPFSGEEKSFDSLVQQAAVGVTANAMRVELIRIGAVEENESGVLIPRRRHAVPDEFDEKLLTSITFNLRGLAHTIAHNSNPSRNLPGRIERFVQSGHLGESQIRILRSDIRGRILQFTEEIDNNFSAFDESPAPGTRRIGVGVFYYEDDVDELVEGD